jgi:hypothetical protein
MVAPWAYVAVTCVHTSKVRRSAGKQAGLIGGRLIVGGRFCQWSPGARCSWNQFIFGGTTEKRGPELGAQHFQCGSTTQLSTWGTAMLNVLSRNRLCIAAGTMTNQSMKSLVRPLATENTTFDECNEVVGSLTHPNSPCVCVCSKATS